MLSRHLFPSTTTASLLCSAAKQPIQFSKTTTLSHHLYLHLQHQLPPFRSQQTVFVAMTHTLRGRCVCDRVRYTLDLEQAPEEAARTTLCHCRSCRRAFGTNYGLTAKVPLAAFRYETGNPKKYRQENGVTREFCGECGAYLCEYGVGFYLYVSCSVSFSPS